MYRNNERSIGPQVKPFHISWRYEYDGPNLLRIDELCDTNKNGLIESNEVTWRVVEVNTHKPGSLGALVGKRVYVYTDAADSSPDSSNDYTYGYDAVGNVSVVFMGSGTVGQTVYYFTQDAFGNEISTGLPSGPKKGVIGLFIFRLIGMSPHGCPLWTDEK